MVNRMLLVAVLLLSAGGVWGAWWLLDAPIGKFVVRGELSALEQAEVNEALARQQFSGILSTSLAEVSAVLSRLPWTREVTVRRQWPDTMVIILKRAHPIARWGEAHYLAASGELMTLPDQYLGLPHFDVAVASPAQTMDVYRLLDQVLLRANLHISRLQQNRQGEWSVQVRNGQQDLTLLLGAEQLNQRAHRFLLLQRQVLADAQQPPAYVDARYASGLAVRYQTVPEESELIGAVPDSIAALAVRQPFSPADLSGGSN